MSDNHEPPPPAETPDARPPASSTPGMIPGATPPVPTGPGPHGSPDEAILAGLVKPTGLARALYGVTAAFAVVMVALAAYARADLEQLRRMLETGETASGPSTLVSLLIMPLLLMTYFLYGMWMSRIRVNRNALRRTIGLPAIEWWGWLVPLASLVLVPWGARRITGRAAPLGVVLGWWIGWVGATSAYAAANIAILGGFDLQTGDIVSQELLDTSVALTWVAAGLTVVSWAFLFVFIRRATDRHLDQ